MSVKSLDSYKYFNVIWKLIFFNKKITSYIPCEQQNLSQLICDGELNFLNLYKIDIRYIRCYIRLSKDIICV